MNQGYRLKTITVKNSKATGQIATKELLYVELYIVIEPR